MAYIESCLKLSYSTRQNSFADLCFTTLVWFLALMHAWDHSLLPGFGRKFGPNEPVSDVLWPGVSHKRRLRELDKYLL